MAQTSVAQFATELGLPASLLLEQLNAAGVKKKQPDDTLNEKDKTQLLDYLRKAHGANEPKKKITLTRRQTTEIKKADSTGKARTIQVEVRKRRVLVKREAGAAVTPPPEAAPEPAAAPVVDAEQLALREEEAKKQAELAARQAADVEQKKQKRQRKKVPEAEPKEKEVAEKVAPEAEVQAQPTERPQAAQPAPSVSEGTLHKPAVKEGEKAGKAEKKAKKQPKQVVWQDEAARRRAIKLRGDVTGGQGWRGRKVRPAYHKTTDEEVGPTRSRCPPSPSCTRCWCRKPLR